MHVILDNLKSSKLHVIHDILKVKVHFVSLGRGGVIIGRKFLLIFKNVSECSEGIAAQPILFLLDCISCVTWIECRRCVFKQYNISRILILQTYVGRQLWLRNWRQWRLALNWATLGSPELGDTRGAQHEVVPEQSHGVQEPNHGAHDDGSDGSLSQHRHVGRLIKGACQ